MLGPRSSGVLVPLFSLRSHTDAGVGDYACFEGLFSWLVQARQRIVMVLPLLPTAPGDPSPYSTRSAFGLNPLFLHLPWLPVTVSLTAQESAAIEQARALPAIDYPTVFEVKGAVFRRAFASFSKSATTADKAAFDAFCVSQASWLDGYALFEALSEKYQRAPWWEWPAPLASRQAAALAVARTEMSQAVRYHQWLQWCGDVQWNRVRALARAKGISLWGDEPFIIGQDSADCWCWPTLLRRDGRLGVPPDEFSDDGQDWGLPVFDFSALEAAHDTWLRARAQRAAASFDARRIDHAIGYFRQYVRDEAHPKGHFVPDTHEAQQARGERNFRLLSEGAGIVAEDLGVIPRFAKDTLANLGLPGYQVMRWAREDGVYRDPRHYPVVSLVTTGTHDTDTLRAWWQTSQPWEREAGARWWPTLHHLGSHPTATFTPEVHEALVLGALQAQSQWCILPWQDIFAEVERVNTPGTVGPHNWAYRIRWAVEDLLVEPEARRGADWLAGLTVLGGR
jgi:4-alpha-glucanotransferase